MAELGVNRRTTLLEAKRVFCRQCLLRHPDKFPNVSHEERARITVEFQILNAAW